METATKVLLAQVAILVLTIVHHLYGAAIYDTPWRHHVALIALPMLAVLIVAYGVYRWRYPHWLGKTSLCLFIALSSMVIAWIGVFEGGYNHLLKNILFFAGLSQDVLVQLFPPPAYEMPNDLWFEVSGVLQFFIALYAIRCLFRLWREHR